MEKELPQHGRIQCSKCYSGSGAIAFDESKCAEDDWRITANPLAWGNPNPEIVVLGFSKGPTQAGALSSVPHEEIAYKSGRANVGKILAHIGVLPSSDRAVVDQAISDKFGPIHFGSLIRCTVERRDRKLNTWLGSGGGMLDRFVQTPFGKRVADNCAGQFLANLPARTKLVVMFGMGTKLNYVKASFKVYQKARGGTWRWHNAVSYTDGRITVVHVEHFASRGRLIPEWLGGTTGKRSSYGLMARVAVVISGVKQYDDSFASTSMTDPATTPKASLTDERAEGC